MVQSAAGGEGICQDITSQLLHTIRAAGVHWQQSADSVGVFLWLNQSNQTAGCHQHQAQPQPHGVVLNHQMNSQ